jgi:ribosomal protein L12E/L44/L45/RPP1/RPP2
MRSAEIWRQLEDEGYMVITSNGKPIALLSNIDDKQLEDYIRAIKQARAAIAVSNLQEKSVKENRSQLSEKEIETEIKNARRNRR